MPQTTPQDSILAQLLLIKNDAALLIKDMAPAFAYAGNSLTGVEHVHFSEKVQVLKIRIEHVENQLMTF